MATTRHFIGHDDEGHRYAVDITLKVIDRPDVHFTDHTRGTLHRTLSITGDVYEERSREPFSAGQIFDHLQNITKPTNGWTLDDIADLADIWREWHLNDTNAASDEQREAGITYQSDPDHVDSSGYKIGSEWLARELPDEVVVKIERLQALRAVIRK